ncbi:MAG: hypothetical protein PHR98_00470 [Candidatus Shapirobacteria bacterium]|nr:hypothetical protein [Candidatus Shapirobacteria bacterium]
MKAIVKFGIIFVVFLLIFFGGLFTTRVINKDLTVDKVKLIFDIPSIRDSVLQHQRDARYLPYRIRLIVFNNFIYVYQALRNIANFWNLYNINDIFLFVNLYPMYYGFKSIYKEKYIWYICVLGIFFGSFAIGINKMVDARMATWFMMPIFVYLIYRGIRKVNIKIYLPLLLINLLFLI